MSLDDAGVKISSDASGRKIAARIKELKTLFAEHLCEPDQVRSPEAVPTGFQPLDRFLLSGGFPKGALTLMKGALGSGATSLWLEAAAHTLNERRWVAWVNQDVPLSPLPLAARGLSLERLVSIEMTPPTLAPDLHPRSDEAKKLEQAYTRKLFWLMQELMSATLFELIGCDLGEMRLKEHQLRKLQAQARDCKVALVFFSRGARPFSMRESPTSVFSLVLNFEKQHLVVERAQARPTPRVFARSVSHERFIGAANANTLPPARDANS